MSCTEASAVSLYCNNTAADLIYWLRHARSAPETCPAQSSWLDRTAGSVYKPLRFSSSQSLTEHLGVLCRCVVPADMDRTQVTSLAFLILLLGMTHVACAARVELKAPGRRLTQPDLTTCYAQYDATMAQVTSAAKTVYDACVTAVRASPDCNLRTLAGIRACAAALNTCRTQQQTTINDAKTAAQTALDSCIADIQQQLAGH